MGRDSVFYKIAKDENSFTELLCNLLMRGDFRACVLPLFVGQELADKIPASAITTQIVLEDCGCPDITIRTAELCALIEVKLNPSRGMTVHQESSGYGSKDRRRYIDYLNDQNVTHKLLLFLIPSDWEHRERLEESFATLKEIYVGIQTGICTWEDIFGALESTTDPVTDEFNKLLRGKLALVRFTPEELQVIHSENFAVAFRATRKLEKLVDEVARSKARRPGNIEWKPEKTEEAYGFNLMAEKRHLLWFGLWEVDGRVYFCYAVSEECDSAVVGAFRKFFPTIEVRPGESNENWYVWQFPDELLLRNASAASAEICKQMDLLLETVTEAVSAT
jgi:hypothetical protein